MALHKRPLDSVRDLLNDAEEIDLNLTGGAFLRDADVGLYADALLDEIRTKFGAAVEIEHFERIVNGITLSVLPQSRTTAVLLHCKGARHIVADARYDATNENIVIAFNLRAPVLFCTTLLWVVLWYAIAYGCFIGGSALVPTHALVAAYS